MRLAEICSRNIDYSWSEIVEDEQLIWQLQIILNSLGLLYLPPKNRASIRAMMKALHKFQELEKLPLQSNIDGALACKLLDFELEDIHGEY